MRPGFLLLALLVPAATGELAIDDVRGPIEPLTPGTQLEAIEIDVSVGCTSLLLRHDPQSGLMPITLDADVPDGVVLITPPSTALSRDQCPTPQDTATHTFNLTVGVDDTLDAFVPQTLAFEVSIPENQLDPVDPQEATFDVQARAVLILQMQLATNFVTVRGPTNLTLDVENLGNSEIVVRFSHEAEKGTISDPAPLTLGQPGSSSARGQVHFLYTPPGGDWREANVVLVATPTAEGPFGTEGSPARGNVLLRQGPSDSGAPGPGPVVALMAVFGAALVASRRRWA